MENFDLSRLTKSEKVVDKLFPISRSAERKRCAIAHQPQDIIQSELKTLENIVDSSIEGLQNYFQVGAALNKIRSDELYKQAEYTNFIDYCRDRFNSLFARQNVICKDYVFAPQGDCFAVRGAQSLTHGHFLSTNI